MLLRPAWPMRVLIDEYARTAASIGTIDTLKSVMSGMGDLRANWFRKNGEDLGPVIQQKMVDNLGLETGDKNYYELVEEYVAKNGEDAAQSLVRDTIYEEYGKRKIRRRTLGASAAAGIVAGPAGLAVGALYGLMARNSLQRLAKMETGTAIGLQLRSVARTQ